MRTHSLGSILGLCFVFFGVLLASIFGGLYNFIIYPDELEQEKRLMLLSGDDLAQNLNGILVEKIRIIRTLISSESVLEELQRSNADYAQDTPELRAERIEGENTAWKVSKSLDDPVVASRLNSLTARTLTRHIAENTGIYGEIFLTNKYGVVIGTTGKLSTLAHAHKYWWLGAYAKGKGRVYIDDRGFDDSVGGVVLGLVLPVKVGGDIIGIIKANLNVGSLLNDFINVSKEGRDYDISIYRSGGLAILDKDIKPLEGMAPDDIKDLLQSRISVGSTVSHSSRDHIHTSSPVPLTLGNSRIQFGGKAHSFDQRKGNDGEFWTVIMSRNVQFLDWKNVSVQIVFFFVIAFFSLVLVTGSWAIRRLIHPLSALAEEIETFSIDKPLLGHYKRAPTEVRGLVKAFTKLTGRLQATLVSRDELFQEVSDRKTAEESLQNANKDLRVISKVNEALVHATTEEQLLNDVLRVIVEEGGFRMAWVGYALDTPDKRVQPIAHYGYEHGYVDEIEISWDAKTKAGQGPVGTAIRTAAPVVTSDVLNDEKFKIWKDRATQRGYQSVMALPLLVEGEAIGALNIYAATPDAFNDANTPFLMKLAEDLAYGVRALQMKDAQAKNEEYLRWDMAVDTALMEVSRTILRADISIDEIATLILEQVRNMTKSEFGFVGYIDQDTGFLVCPTFTRDIWDKCNVKNKSAVFEKFTGLFGWVLNNKEPLLTNDPTRDHRSIGTPPGHVPIEKFLAVPALVGDELLGEIAIANPVGDYGDRDLYLMERIANFYAIALQRLRADEQIKESDLRARLLMESTGEGIYAIDLKGVCTICNPAALAMLGYDDANEVIGQHMHELIHHTHADGSKYPKSKCPICKIRPKGAQVQNEDDVLWRKDGSSFRASYKANPIIQDGTITGAVVSFMDITERLQAEQQLWQSQKVESIGNLAGGIAHDINNMLLPIQALTEMTLKDLPEGSRAVKRLTKVLEASEQAKNLVSQILMFSRKEEPKIERVNLAETVRSVLELLRSTVPSTLTIFTQMKDVGNVKADVSQIHAVLLNLASNSAGAMEGNVGNLSITLSSRKATKKDATYSPIKAGKPYAVLRVKDDGTGMDENTLNRLFDPFFTTKAPGEGTGLGLSVVHGIVSKHGGAIQVHSKVGKGTTFEIYLPIVK